MCFLDDDDDLHFSTFTSWKRHLEYWLNFKIQTSTDELDHEPHLYWHVGRITHKEHSSYVFHGCLLHLSIAMQQERESILQKKKLVWAYIASQCCVDNMGQHLATWQPWALSLCLLISHVCFLWVKGWRCFHPICFSCTFMVVVSESRSALVLLHFDNLFLNHHQRLINSPCWRMILVTPLLHRVNYYL